MLVASLLAAVLAIVSLFVGLFVVTDSLLFIFIAIALIPLAVVLLIAGSIQRSRHDRARGRFDPTSIGMPPPL